MHRDNYERYQVQLAPSLAGHKRLGSYLIDAGLINRGQVEVALNDQKATGMKFGEILVTRGWIKQQTVEFIMEKVVLPERLQANAKPQNNLGKKQLATARNSARPGKATDRQRSQANASPHMATLQQEFTHSHGAERGHGATSQSSSSTAASKKKAASSQSQPDQSTKTGQRRVPPISKPLPSVPAQNDGINWVG